MNPTLVYLAQTDTTVGFLSQDSTKLEQIKNRSGKKGFIVSVDSFKTLKTFTRVPKKYKNTIRRSKKTTFVYPHNLAIRVVKDRRHLSFLKRVKWMYSTSANKTDNKFDEDYAIAKADVILYNKTDFNEKNPSKLIKCGKITKRRLR